MFSEVEKPELFKNAYTEKAIYLKYDQAPVYYMITQRGDAIEIHVGADGREGKKALREACKAVIEWVKDNYKWCDMLIAPVSIKSVYNLCKKLGFSDYGEYMFENGKARVMGISYG